METQTPAQEQQTVNLQDIALMTQIISISTERGAFKAEELANVGTLYSKLTAFLKQQQELAVIAKEQLEKAQSNNTQTKDNK